MNLTTSYLGLTLKSPFIAGASPLADDVGIAHRLEDLGIGAIVMRSLFAEQIYLDSLESGMSYSDLAAVSGARMFPLPQDYRIPPESYLAKVSELKRELGVPVIASLNGAHPGGWIDYVRRFAEAGADAVELNLYDMPVDPSMCAADVESEMLETVRQARAAGRIPLAVKLSPHHSAPAHFARELERAGADGIILFNRLFQDLSRPDDGSERPRLELSTPSELALRVRWLAALSPCLQCSLAVSGGVHCAEGAAEAIAAGADAVQIVSVILRNGPRIVPTLIAGTVAWMEEQGVRSLDELRDSRNLAKTAHPESKGRALYQRNLQSWGS